MKAFLLALVVSLGFMTTHASSAPWGDAQAQKGRSGREQAEPPRGRPAPPPDRSMQGDQRQRQLNEDERRALHRDLDKANRELYRRR
jgi:hypothetical protein